MQAVRNRERTQKQVRTVEEARKRWPRLAKVVSPAHLIHYIRHPSFGEQAMLRYAIHTRPKKHPQVSGYFPGRTGQKKRKSGQDTSILGWHAPVFRKGWM